MKASLVWVAVVLVYAQYSEAWAGPKPLSAGGVTAKAPSGWRGSAQDGALVFAPSRGADDLSVMVSEVSPPAGSAEDVISQSWTQLSAALQLSNKQLGPASTTAAGYELLIATGTVRSDGRDSIIAVAAVVGSGAQAVVVVVAKDGKVFEKHATAIGALIDSIALSGSAPSRDAGDTARSSAGGSTDAAGTAKGGSSGDFPEPSPIEGMGEGVAGAWAVLRTGARASASSMTGVDVSAQWDVFVLLPNGHYTTRIHPEGLNWKTAADLEAKWPQYWGTYTKKGKKVTLTRGDTVSTYKLDGDVLVPTGDTGGSDMVRADTGADLRIEGSFARYNIGAKSFGDKVPTVVFHRDGTFEDRYQGVYTVTQQGAKEWTGASGQGRYRIRHNTLYLLYDDGRKIFTHIAVLPTGGTRDKPKGLYVGDYWMTRR